MILKTMQIRQATVIFVDDYISKNNVTKEQSEKVLNRVAARMQLQLTMKKMQKEQPNEIKTSLLNRRQEGVGYNR